MTDWLHQTNFAFSTLAAQLLIAGASLSMTAGEGARFPHAAAADHFQLVIWGASSSFPSMDPNREIVHAHYNSADTYDITRAQEGTTAKQWEIGDKCALVLSARHLGDIEDTIDGYLDQAVKVASSPAFAGATIGSLAGFIVGTAGVLSALDYVPWTTPAFDANNFAGTGAMTWTVEAGDVSTYAYMIIGKKMTVAFAIGSAVIGGTPSYTVCIKVPASKTITKTIYGVGMSYNNSAWAASRLTCSAADTFIRISIDTGESAAWTAGASYVRGEITFEIN